MRNPHLELAEAESASGVAGVFLILETCTVFSLSVGQTSHNHPLPAEEWSVHREPFEHSSYSIWEPQTSHAQKKHPQVGTTGKLEVFRFPTLVEASEPQKRPRQPEADGIH